MLEAAKEWGVPPWIIEDGDAIWYERWKYQTMMIRKIERLNNGKSNQN